VGVCICVYVLLSMCVHSHLGVHVPLCASVCKCVYISVCPCVTVCKYMWLCLCLCVFACECVGISMCAFLCTCVCLCVWMCFFVCLCVFCACHCLGSLAFSLKNWITSYKVRMPAVTTLVLFLEDYDCFPFICENNSTGYSIILWCFSLGILSHCLLVFALGWEFSFSVFLVRDGSYCTCCIQNLFVLQYFSYDIKDIKRSLLILLSSQDGTDKYFIYGFVETSKYIDTCFSVDLGHF
jgi:hypothetical protein